MQFLNLTTQNLGVFDSRHDFDLTPIRNADGSVRSVTLITGHNGAGKSTLFESLRIALHGPLALGDRVSRSMYSRHLSGRIHRRAGTGQPIVRPNAGVSLSFQYVQSGVPQRINVDREWQRQGENIHEVLSVLLDGTVPGIAAEDYQHWLNDLLPPPLSTLSFFDAEQLDRLVDPLVHSDQLQETFHRLLGLELVSRLGADLGRYTLSRRGGTQDFQTIRAELLRLQSELDGLDEQLERYETSQKELAAEQARLEGLLGDAERRLLSEGGSYAARRADLQERVATVEQEVQSLEDQLRELIGDLVPFTLVPELCLSLRQRLRQESDIRRSMTAEGVWKERLPNVREKLESDDIWRDLGVSSAERGALTERLIHVFLEMGNLEGGQRLTHRLSDHDHQQIEHWIAQAVHVLPDQVTLLAHRLRAFQGESRQISDELGRVPEDEALAPIHADIAELEEALARVRRDLADVQAQRTSTEMHQGEQRRSVDRLAERLRQSELVQQQVVLAERSRAALRTFADALTRQRLSQVERSFVPLFNTICQKNRLLEEVRIDPKTYRVDIRGTDGEAVQLADFSAGERQLYALALLWALRQVSGRQLPLAIDTPLARLDEEHRERFVHRFLPAVSNQVILFATDAEFDAGLLAQAEPYIARIYRLAYDADAAQTTIKWEGSTGESKGLILRLSERQKELAYDA